MQPPPPPNHLCTHLPASYHTAVAHTVSCAAMPSFPFSPESLLPNFPHRLHCHLLREAVLISLVRLAPAPSVQAWFYLCLGHLILACLPACHQLPGEDSLPALFISLGPSRCSMNACSTRGVCRGSGAHWLRGADPSPREQLWTTEGPCRRQPCPEPPAGEDLGLRWPGVGYETTESTRQAYGRGQFKIKFLSVGRGRGGHLLAGWWMFIVRKNMRVGNAGTVSSVRVGRHWAVIAGLSPEPCGRREGVTP